MPLPRAYVVDASVVVHWLVGGPYAQECQTLLVRCGDLDVRLLAPTCLYSEVANALYRLCLAKPPISTLLPEEAIALVHAVAAFDIALVDRVHRLDSGAIALTPQWEQLGDGRVRDYRSAIYARGIELSYPTRRGSLFDMSYAALAEQAGSSLWTVDERFYNSARASGLAFVMHPGRDPLP
ncbi:MAG TPA: type II toxin-antitoxin system VapC family toxin [Chloroflexota bacterium]|nr:type II toxin-antitoxin system VapC family toxin [Chloroflexota bacterium]